MKATYEAVTARENLGVIRAVGIFGVGLLLCCFPFSWLVGARTGGGLVDVGWEGEGREEVDAAIGEHWSKK